MKGRIDSILSNVGVSALFLFLLCIIGDVHGAEEVPEICQSPKLTPPKIGKRQIVLLEVGRSKEKMMQEELFQYVYAWLKKKYKNNPIPRFEVTPTTLATLYNIAKINESRDRDCELMISEYEQRAAEYSEHGALSVKCWSVVMQPLTLLSIKTTRGSG